MYNVFAAAPSQSYFTDRILILAQVMFLNKTVNMLIQIKMVTSSKNPAPILSQLKIKDSLQELRKDIS